MPNTKRQLDKKRKLLQKDTLDKYYPDSPASIHTAIKISKLLLVATGLAFFLIFAALPLLGAFGAFAGEFAFTLLLRVFPVVFAVSLGATVVLQETQYVVRENQQEDYSPVNRYFRIAGEILAIIVAMASFQIMFYATLNTLIMVPNGLDSILIAGVGIAVVAVIVLLTKKEDNPLGLAWKIASPLAFVVLIFGLFMLLNI